MVFVLVALGVILLLIVIVLLSPRRFRERHGDMGAGTIDASEEGFEAQSLEREGEFGRERASETGEQIP